MTPHTAFFLIVVAFITQEISVAQSFSSIEIEFDGRRMKRLAESAKNVKSEMRDWCRQKLATCRIFETWVPEAGLTVPSPWYSSVPPQYFPPSDSYPLPKELQQIEDAAK